MTKKQLRKEFTKFLKILSVPNEEIHTEVLLKASAHNTYVETVSNKADTLHYHIDKNYVEILNLEYNRFMKHHIQPKHVGLCDVIVDITEEDFYGRIEGLYIHPWTGEQGVEGKFHYLVAGILFRNKILPFYVMILHVGCFKAEYLGKIVEQCKAMGLKVGSMLLDRGFYSGDIVDTLDLQHMNYLIFVPKKELFKCMLQGTEKSVKVLHEISYKKDKTTHKANTVIALVKGKEYDWVFATDLFFDNPRCYVRLYRKRWNIETMFRVHDEGRIKTKSVNPVIRLFYFMLSMLLVFVWNLYAKEEYGFKEFVIMLYEISRDVVEGRAF